MKKITVFIALLAISSVGYAQIGAVSPVKVKMSQGVQDGFKVLIPEVDAWGAEKAWEKLIRGYDGKTSKVSKTEDLESVNVLIPSIEDTAIVVYSNFNQTPEGVYMNVFFVSHGTYFNNASSKSAAINKLLKEFARITAYDAVNERLENEAKQLEKLEKEQRGL